MIKNVMATLATALIMLCSISAATATHPPHSHPSQGTSRPAQNSSSPQDIVRSSISNLSAFKNPKGANATAQTIAFLNNNIAPHFDFTGMTQAAAGPAYRSMSHAQRATLQQKIKAHFLKTLANNLGRNPANNIRYIPTRYPRRGAAIVALRIRQPGAHNLRVSFRFNQYHQNWKVLDVSVNGSSAISYYRGFTRRILSRNKQPFSTGYRR